MCISGAPADGTNFHVSFYPDPRLTAHSYKKFLAGSPADGSQRVKQRLKTLIFNMLQLTYVDMTMLSALDFGLGRAMAL